MKPSILAVAAVVTLAVPASLHAQQAPLMRGDVAGTVGWLNGNKTEVHSQSNDWYNRGLYLGAQAGWYWTDHHKTEVEAGITAPIDFWTYRSFTVDGVTAWGGSDFTYKLGRVAVGQHYQLLRNAWVHPYVGAGVDVTWERSTERAEPLIIYDYTGRGPREIRPGGTFGPDTTVRVRPYLQTGFKAYMNRRAFFRSDLRVLVRDRLDEVLLRCGFGIDF